MAADLVPADGGVAQAEPLTRNCVSSTEGPRDARQRAEILVPP